VIVPVTPIPRRPGDVYRCPSASALWKFLWKLLWKFCMHIFQIPGGGSEEYDVYSVYNESLF